MRHILSAISAFVGTLLTTGSLMAASPCGDMVVDNLGLLSVNDITRIESAAKALEAQGATVYIRLTEDKLGYASLATAADNACSWSGDRIVLWIEDATGDATILAGPAWNEVLPESVLGRIIDEQMLPGLGSDAFANGFIRPINFIASEVMPEVGGTTIINEAPAANQWSAIVIGIVVGGILLFAAGFWFLSRWTRRNKLRSSAITLGEQAKNRLDEFNELSGAITKLLKREVVLTLSSSVLETFKTKQKDVTTRADTVNGDFDGHRDPATLGYNFGEYEALEVSLRKSLDEIKKMTEEFQALKREIEAAELQAKNAPARYVDVKEAYDSALARVKAVKDDGFTVTSILTSLGQLKVQLDEAKSMQDRKDFAGAEKQLAAVETSAQASAELAEELPRRKASIVSDQADLESRLDGMAVKVEAALDAYERMEADFDPLNFDVVEGNGVEAEELIDEAEDAIDAVVAAVEDQKWDEAEHSVEVAQKRLTKADDLLRAVHEQEGRVNRAREEAPKELQEARRSLEQAEAFIERYQGDMTSSFTAAIETVSARIQLAEELLRARRPNYIKALKVAMEADAAADTIFEQAEDQREAAVRKRRRAAKEQEEALDELSDIKRYMNARSDDMGNRTLQMLGELQVAADELEEETDTDRILALVQSFSRSAERVMEQAKSDFQEEEEKRQAAQAAADAAASAARRARQARKSTSPSVTRNWGQSTRNSTSATRRWNTGGNRTSTSATRSFRRSPSSSTSATRKWK